jgi:hypothetical protein
MSLIPVDTQSQKLPLPTHNAGLYSGPAFAGDWGNTYVTPTATNLINNNLNSANPPPGANTQYPGTDRTGNNIVNMPGVYWYTPKDSKCIYRMKVTNDTSQKEYKCCGISSGMSNYYFLSKN